MGIVMAPDFNNGAAGTTPGSTTTTNNKLWHAKGEIS